MDEGLAKEAEECQVRISQAKQDNENLALLSKKLESLPNDPELRCQMAEIFLRQGEVREGLRWLESILMSQPNHRRSNLALAAFFEREGKLDLAAKHRLRAEGKN
jgi:Flp pilus assembly protein TadD